MTIRLLMLASLVFTALSGAFGQVEKSFHQTLPVDDARKITLDMPDQYEIVPWMGNTVLIETKVSLKNASQEVLNYVVKQGRYDIVLQREGESARLVAKNPNRASIKIKTIECEETIKVKIFVPEEFKAISETELEIK